MSLKHVKQKIKQNLVYEKLVFEYISVWFICAYKCSKNFENIISLIFFVLCTLLQVFIKYFLRIIVYQYFLYIIYDHNLNLNPFTCFG